MQIVTAMANRCKCGVEFPFEAGRERQRRLCDICREDGTAKSRAATNARRRLEYLTAERDLPQTESKAKPSTPEDELERMNASQLEFDALEHKRYLDRIGGVRSEVKRYMPEEIAAIANQITPLNKIRKPVRELSSYIY
jgi:hypothetical protein